MEQDGESVPTTKWFFDVRGKQRSQTNDLNFNRIKGFLYESLYRSITRHNLKECHLLLKLLPKEHFLDPYILLRFILILLESNPTKKVHKNVIIYLELLMSNFEISRPDAFLEFLSYFIRHNRIDDARELFAQRHRYISYKNHRSLPTIRVNLRCYEFLLNYLEWNEKISQKDYKKSDIDVSTQGWIVNAMECLRTTQSNHEYFVILVVKVLLYYGYYKRAYLLVYEFQRNNSENLGIQLLLNNLIDNLEALQDSSRELVTGEVPMDCDLNDEERLRNRSKELEKLNNFSSNMNEERFDSAMFPIREDKTSIFKNIRRLDPSRREMLELIGLNENPIDILRDLMDGMEVVQEVKNTSRWTKILETLETILASDNQKLKEDARTLWQIRYRTYWNRVSFLSLAGNNISLDNKTLIIKVTSLLREKFSISSFNQEPVTETPFENMTSNSD